MADDSGDILNLHKECSECGKCCTLTVLSMSVEEMERVRTYAAENGIVPVDAGPEVCPFRGEDMRCRVYPARPTICRLHHCSIPRSELVETNPDVPIIDDLPLMDTRKAFIEGVVVDPREMPLEWIVERFAQE